MTTAPNLTEILLHQIQHGETEAALQQLDPLLAQQPNHPGLLTLKAEALRFSNRGREAIGVYQRAGAVGGGARNWLVAGHLLVADRRIDEALASLTYAIAEDPGNEEILNTLVTTLFNAHRARDGMLFARRLIGVSQNPTYLANAALLLQSNELYEEATGVFKQFVRDDSAPATLAAALVPARFTCEWDWIESLQDKLLACYARGDFDRTQEYPLTHVTWCTNEAYNLEVTRAYAARMLPNPASLPTAPRPACDAARIRLGYLSSDFCNHATMHLMAGLLESHDRSRFEVFAYDSSPNDGSAYRQRFLDAVEHHVDITALNDADAAARIAADRLDILFDLKGHTGWGRLGIMAYRPAPLQAAYLGFPGSTATGFIDYLVCDRIVVPDSSAPHYSEKLCRLPHTYQCNDDKRPMAGAPSSRAAHGLPDDAVVFCAFNQSYKIDRGSFSVWMEVLQLVPDSVLWLLSQGPAAERHLRQQAADAGVAPERLLFAPFAAPDQHLARLQLADAALDALICNGHTTTSDMLWAGIPVVTARGHHFASRVSESLLQAIGMAELVGHDGADMVRIAARIGLDTAYRQALREQLAARRHTAPLFDTRRFAANFENAVAAMVERSRSGLPLVHLDVPDAGARAA
jgi:predicted O-linked N-acetylglucosamine transferase (SPINDLY family)